MSELRSRGLRAAAPPVMSEPRGHRRPGAGGRRGRRRRQRGGAVIPLLLVLAVVLVSGAGYGGYNLLARWRTPDYSGLGSGEAVIQVKEGDTLRDIAVALRDADVVKSVKAFVLAAAAESRATSIQPASYRMRQQMKASAALALMLDSDSRTGQITIPEGLRQSQVLELIASKSELSAAALQTAAKNTPALGLPAYAGGNAEGFLFPSTYDVGPGTTAEQLLRQMVDRHKAVASKLNLTSGAARLRLTPYQILIVASLTQAEARHKEDFPKVARVIYNRLAIDQPLQFDSTVNYALNQNVLKLSDKDLAIDSRYNTYKHPGLPPGPICEPGEDALRAALQPAAGSWRYFVTTNPQTGETKFTSSDEEFLELKREFDENVRRFGKNRSSQ